MQSISHFLTLIGALYFAASASLADESAAPGPFTESECIACHAERDPKLIESRQRGPHGAVGCIDCHGGKKSPVVHSYLTSKHGVLMRLEENSYDWQQPFLMANYRAPGCSYCHLHQAGHNVNKMVRPNLMDVEGAKDVEIEIRKVCQDCHAPRYIVSLLVSGEDMLEIARKKVREANTLVTKASEHYSDNELEPARKAIQTMQKHLKNVYLGAGHQSPDYQWWHGQPALDGDLLRVKGIVGELYRKKRSGAH